MIKRVFKYGMIGMLAVALLAGVTYQVMAAPSADDFLFCVHVEAEYGEEVHVTFPPQLLNTLYDVMPKKVQLLCKQMELTPDVIMAELETLDGEDMIRVEGKDNVRVWLEPVTEDNRRDLGFVRVMVDEGREEGHVINVFVPQGLARLAGNVIAKTGIVEDIELPEELEMLLETE